ncbi:MAG: 30S ribosomal protein S19 [Flavobacterium sp.]|nr:MAG: 30S ribosomal protein S19 [Flavobacterium sp.]
MHNDFIEQKKVNKEHEDIVLFNRATVLTKQMVGLKLQVYNGIRFFPLNVTNDMLGHRVGEFAPTRKKPIPKKKKKK